MTDALPGFYGEAPVDLGGILMDDRWHEFMHYLYLPVRVPKRDLRALPEGVRKADGPWARLPERMWFLDTPLRIALLDAAAFEHLADPYVYITARRGFATPGNPLNRPGWHCDDFGGTDLNYIWSDIYPTRLLRSDYPIALPDDDVTSMDAMAAYERRWDAAGMEGETNRKGRAWIEDAPTNRLLRLSPYVIHDTPVIPAPGGMRSFFKISVSSHRYNLLGNSHNYLLDYDWPMHDRQAIRNQPGGNGDYYEEPSHA